MYSILNYITCISIIFLCYIIIYYEVILYYYIIILYYYIIFLYNNIMLYYVIIIGALELLELTCPNVWTCLFNLKPGVLSKTLSHIWGKLNLPMFLFNVRLLTLMNIHSLILLAKLCCSLPIIWKLLWLVGWPVWLLCWWMGEGSFRCSLYLSPKVLEVSPLYSSS